MYDPYLLYAKDMSVFVDTSIKKMGVVMDYLNTFCNFTRQQVSVSKTRVLFFKNISLERTNNIREIRTHFTQLVH